MITRTLRLYKTSFTGLSVRTWLLSLVMLINRSGTMVVPFMTLYLTSREMNRTLSEAGTVMGLFGLGAVVGAYFGGKFSDRIGFYKVQLITLFFGGLMFIVLGQVKSYPLICVVTFFLSMVNEAFRPANSSAIAFYSTPGNRTRSYSLNRLAVNLGWAVGTSLGGFIAAYNYNLLFWVDGFTNIGAALLMFLFFRPSLKVQGHEEKKEESAAVTSAYKDRIYLWFIFLVILFAFCFFQMFTTVPKYFRDDLHLNERYIGMIMALNGLVIVLLEMVLVFKLEGRRHNLYYIRIGVLVCAMAFLSLLIPGDAKLVTLFMMLLITVGEIVSMPFMNSFWTMRSKHGNRGQYAALYTIAWAVAQTLGPVICSRVADHFGFAVLFIVMTLICVLSAFGFYRLNKLEQASA